MNRIPLFFIRFLALGSFIFFAACCPQNNPGSSNNGLTEPLEIYTYNANGPLSNVKVYLNDSATPVGKTDVAGEIRLPDVMNTNKVILKKSGNKTLEIDFTPNTALDRIAVKIHPDIPSTQASGIEGYVLDSARQGIEQIIVNANTKTESTVTGGEYNIKTNKNANGFFAMAYIFPMDAIQFRVKSNNPEEEITIQVDADVTLDELIK